MQGLFLKGTSVLKKEIEGSKKIPEDRRLFYKDHIVGEEGEGEPHPIDQEIVIESQYDVKNRY